MAFLSDHMQISCLTFGWDCRMLVCMFYGLETRVCSVNMKNKSKAIIQPS